MEAQRSEDLGWRNPGALARVFEAKGDRQRARRFIGAAGRARRVATASLTHAQLTELYAQLREGNSCALAGDPTRAEAVFLAALALHEGDQTACNGLANLRITQGRIAEAEEFLRQGTTLGDRVYPTLLLKRGALLEQMGRRKEARDIYQRLVTLMPRYAPARGRLQALDAIEAAAA